MPILINLVGFVYLLYYAITSILEYEDDDSQKYFGRTPVHRKIHYLIGIMKLEKHIEEEVERKYCVGAFVMGICSVFLAITICCLYKKHEKDLLVGENTYTIELLRKLKVEAIAEAKEILLKKKEKKTAMI